ncbi:MAG: hypothetical protein MJ233_04700 [Mycoplasmoidaceae bacterium]|nr:hypothetical protein [Mycoplasmoidaceae bacterium]
MGSVIKITFEPFEPTEDTNISINVCAQQNTDVPIRVKFMGVGEKDVEFSFDPSYIEVKQYIDFPHITLTTNCDIGTISIINVFGDNPQSLESASFVEGSEYTITKQGPQN